MKVLLVLKKKVFSSNHNWIFLMSLWIFWNTSFHESPVTIKTVSSAKQMSLPNSERVLISFTWTMRRWGERDLFCGTPHLINSPELKVLLTLVYCKRADK